MRRIEHCKLHCLHTKLIQNTFWRSFALGWVGSWRWADIRFQETQAIYHHTKGWRWHVLLYVCLRGTLAHPVPHLYCSRNFSEWKRWKRFVNAAFGSCYLDDARVRQGATIRALIWYLEKLGPVLEGGARPRLPAISFKKPRRPWVFHSVKARTSFKGRPLYSCKI